MIARTIRLHGEKPNDIRHRVGGRGIGVEKLARFYNRAEHETRFIGFRERSCESRGSVARIGIVYSDENTIENHVCVAPFGGHDERWDTGAAQDASSDASHDGALESPFSLRSHHDGVDGSCSRERCDRRRWRILERGGRNDDARIGRPFRRFCKYRFGSHVQSTREPQRTPRRFFRRRERFDFDTRAIDGVTNGHITALPTSERDRKRNGPIARFGAVGRHEKMFEEADHPVMNRSRTRRLYERNDADVTSSYTFPRLVPDSLRRECR